ncbi:MAG: hypothetical protein IPH13_22725 [Planctomycetes bacterium]|nr:hypothetical protein [Planctomycetota bacterium]MCC7172233.1 hypothetical protein [Planctomycetota bacterium]
MNRRFEHSALLAFLLTACATWSSHAPPQPLPIGPAVVDGSTQPRIVEIEPPADPPAEARYSLAIDGLDEFGPRYGECVVQYAMGITTGFDALLGTRDLDGEGSLYAARVPHGHATDRASWRYMAGDDRFSEREDDARPLFVGNDGRVTVFWSKPLQRFLAIHGRIDRAGYALVARAAHEPVGPYGPPRVLTRIAWRADSIPSDVRVHADDGVVGGVEGERILVTVFDPAISARRAFCVMW